MAALYSRLVCSLTRSVAFGNVPLKTRQVVKPIHQRLTWSQFKHIHNKSRTDSALITTDRRSRSSRYWFSLLATAGFTQGFLGFNLGEKKGDGDNKKIHPLLKVYSEAKHLHMTQDFNKAEIRYHDALKVADELFKMKKLTQKKYVAAKTNIYDSLADMALGLGELEKAEGLYKETMKGCLQQGLPKDDNAIMEISIKLASIYAMLDRPKDAEDGLNFCIKSQEAKIAADKESDGKVMEEKAKTMSDGGEDYTPELLRRDTQALLGMALETLGRLLMGQRRLGEAVPILERALGVAEGVMKGKDKGQVLVLMNDLATAHLLLQHWDAAADILNEAIKAAATKHASQLPVLYCNLGATFLRTSRLDDAQEACIKAQDLSSKNNNTTAFKMSQKCLEKIEQVKKGAA